MAIALRIEEETDYHAGYEGGLDETIAELRLQNERECAQYKMELEYRYKDKVRNRANLSMTTKMTPTTSKLMSNNTTDDTTHIPAGRSVQHHYEPL